MLETLKHGGLMKLQQLISIFVFSTFLSVTSFAEPINLDIIKNQLKTYVSDGNYTKEEKQATAKGKADLDKWLNSHPNTRKTLKPAVIFDIDETSLSNYPDILSLNFGGTQAELNKKMNEGKDPVIKPTLFLYQYAKNKNFTIFFLTGRPDSMRESTIHNLHAAGYDGWKQLIMRDATNMNQPATIYKTAERKKIEDQGYTIVLSVGDQQSDLDGGYAVYTVKMPNPFYFIP